jgi:hypothetical protein
LSHSSEESDPRLAFAEAKFGITVAEFMASDVGRYLAGRAEEMLSAARDELETVTPEELPAAQLRAAVPRAFLRWLDDALTNGRVAEEFLRQAEEAF